MIRTYRLWLTAVLAFVAWGVSAHVPDYVRKVPRPDNKVQYREVCSNSKSTIDQEINNVRARLLGGGDCWWNFKDGRYIVPKVDAGTGQLEVSSLYAGSVWLGGIDPGGSLKLACQDYRSDGKNDFWPGPLTEQGITDQFTCTNWDKHFRVRGEDIRKHLANLANGNLNEADIPTSVKGWPGQKNPYFADVWGYDLPFTEQALAGFFDADDDRKYDPLKGDYPSIEIRGCPLDRYPDEMIFWIYNDQGAGAPHARTNGKPIQMEVQVQAFGYLTNDELNDMTFQRYKLINRAVERIDSMFFAMWIDPDLGCSIDDYVGCDTSKDLMYVYNQDPVDGQPGSTCDGVPTYGEKVPILGVDYFRGPLDTFGNELGMSSFMYYNRGGTGQPPATTDPSAPGEYYNYITGTWRDGVTPLTYGGSGFNPGDPNAARIRYCFTEAPNDQNGWSMCTANLAFGDRRTLQASGPFTLKPGAVNELIIGIPWVPEQEYPCPDLDALFRADILAQGLFNSCFNLLDGPDAPTTNWIELNQEVIAVLSNTAPSNNAVGGGFENYKQLDFLAVDSTFYEFEGYLIYQLNNPNVSTADFDDVTKSRLVYNVDVKNNVTKIYNWIEGRDPFTKEKIYFPEEKIAGQDKGIKHTFSIKEDKFASTNDKALINHKKYYFAVIAYAYNNFENFNPVTGTGQKRAFLPGRKSGDGSATKIYTVIPRPIVDQALKSSYGDGVEITRLEGVGTGGNFLDITQGTRDRLLDPNFDSTLTYQAGRAPINVTIFNPFEVKDGDYQLVFVDSNPNDTRVDDTARWELRKLPDGEVIVSQNTIAKLNEQLILQYGFSVTIAQTAEPGDLATDQNGGVGMEVQYADPNNPWLDGLPDGDVAPLNYIRTKKGDVNVTSAVNDYDPNDDGIPLDPNQGLTTLGNADDGPLGWFVPYVLANWRFSAQNDVRNDRLITPAWNDRFNNVPQGQFNSQAVFAAATKEATRRSRLALLPNVDIVFTSDKSKWSRCAVIETASLYFTDEDAYPDLFEIGLQVESPANRKRQNFDLRYGLSVGKDDNDGDGRPDPDGEVNPVGSPNGQAGLPMRGMGWFPGYAVDVESGQRLNIFFGENSAYDNAVDPLYTGRDMLWNPTSQVLRGDQFNDVTDLILGGHHWVYVTYSRYDGCDSIRRAFTPEFYSNSAIYSNKVKQVSNIAWAGMLRLPANAQMKPLRDGLIPNDAIIKIRVDNSYKTWWNPNDPTKKTAHPKYLISIKDRESVRTLDNVQIENALDSVKVVPNPYYGFSQYEVSQFSNVIKITNLPGNCKVTIYSLDGKFIRQYNRNEVYQPYQQITPDIEWDLKNSKGIPVASGVYLIQIQAPGMGERTVKWFGIGRQFDPSGL